MAVRRLRWNSLLHYAELEFEPDAPKVLEVTDELVQSISWLTGATGHDRRLLRCTEQGALLVANPWDVLSIVEAHELYPQQNNPAVDVSLPDCKGVLISTFSHMIKISFVLKAGSPALDVYVPLGNYFWYPHKCYTITATLVPASSSTPDWVGVTFFI